MKNEKLRLLLQEGLATHVFPGAVLLVLHQDGEILFEAVGHAALEPDPLPMRKTTVFDLASLTKPLATSLAFMKLVDLGLIDLDEPLAELFPEIKERDKQDITPRHLLSHSSGLRDWEPFYSTLDGVLPGKRKQRVRERILGSSLLFPTGSKTLYSDLGFMVLEWIVERRTGATLDHFLQEQLYGPLGLKDLFLYDLAGPVRPEKTVFAATELCPWRGRVLQGEVDDENAYAMGGYSGHAGLFGTAEEVGKVARFLLQRYRGKGRALLGRDTVRSFFSRQDEPKETTWALGWDTPSPSGSSTGSFFSKKSVGHLGFTGTSLWIDLVKDVIVVFLTNRVHPSRENEKIRNFRPRLHDCVMEVLGFAKKEERKHG